MNRWLILESVLSSGPDLVESGERQESEPRVPGERVSTGPLNQAALVGARLVHEGPAVELQVLPRLALS
jgi:hypothetical protein